MDVLSTNETLEKLVELISGSFDPLAGLEPQPWDWEADDNGYSDPIERLEQAVAPPTLQLASHRPQLLTEETFDRMTSTRREQRIAEEMSDPTDPTSPGAFQAAQARNMPSVKQGKRWFQQGNGEIPQERLMPVGSGHMLKPNAARAFKAMRRAAKKDGVTITLTDSYRDLATQQRLAQEKGLYSQGGLAAVPGTSNHGWGLAVDVGEGEQRAWLARNAKRFGFETIAREPWHWEYEGGFAPAVRQPRRRPRKRDDAPAPSTPLVDAARIDTDPLVHLPMPIMSVVGEVRQMSRARTPQEQERISGLGFVPKRFRQMFMDAAKRYGVDARLLAAIGQAESGFDPKAVSSAGAQGVMQVMPDHGLKSPFNARQNILKGAEIFASYLNAAKDHRLSRNHDPIRLALAMYNAGPAADDNLLLDRMQVFADPILEAWRG
jgi:LAS superfamily LD-carboxypeptidase LdcB